MEYVINILVFALAVSVKGGLLGRIFKNWKRLTDKLDKELKEANQVIASLWDGGQYLKLLGAVVLYPFVAFAKWFVDGSIISWFIILGVTLLQLPVEDALVFTLAYALIFQSMGEEAGAVGDYKGGWGDYVEFPDNFGRSYGIKKAFQYGAVLGGALGLVMASWTLFIAGAAMPLVYFAGSSLRLWLKGEQKRGWAYSEPMWGAALGLAFVLAKHGYMAVSAYMIACTHFSM